MMLAFLKHTAPSWFIREDFLFNETYSKLYGLGERTFGVLTKLDLMDKGTNALDVRF